MVLGFLYNLGRTGRIINVSEGHAPSDFFLGAVELAGEGIAVLHFELDPHLPVGFGWGMVNKLQITSWLPDKLTGSLLQQVWQQRQRLNSCDCLVATTSGLAFSLAFWKKIGVIKPPLVAIHCGLANSKYDRPVRKALTCQFLRGMHSVVYGQGEVRAMIELCQGIDSRLSVNQFGVDVKFWIPDDVLASQGGDVLAVGNDGRRDYSTLIEAAESIDRQVTLLTSHRLPSVLPPNVKHIAGNWHSQSVSDIQLRQMYRQAFCVVVPLHESYQPSGQSVTLQAMACGTPVILTRTAGLWSEEMIRDRETVLLVPPGSPQKVVEAIEKLRDEPMLREQLSRNGREIVERHANIDLFARRLFQVCEELVE